MRKVALPVNLLRPQGSEAGQWILALADPSLLTCSFSACESSIKAAFPIIKEEGVRPPPPHSTRLQGPQKCLLSFPRIPHHSCPCHCFNLSTGSLIQNGILELWASSGQAENYSTPGIPAGGFLPGVNSGARSMGLSYPDLPPHCPRPGLLCLVMF